MSVDTFSIAGVVVGGEKRRIQLLDNDGYQLYLADLPTGLCLEIAISPEGEVGGPRAQQVKYWWAVPVRVLAAHFGTSPRAMHRDLLGECFGYERNVFDKWIPVKPSLSCLSAEEMSTLIDWAIDYGRNVCQVEIPVPEKRR